MGHGYLLLPSVQLVMQQQQQLLLLLLLLLVLLGMEVVLHWL